MDFLCGSILQTGSYFYRLVEVPQTWFRPQTGPAPFLPRSTFSLSSAEREFRSASVAFVSQAAINGVANEVPRRLMRLSYAFGR